MIKNNKKSKFWKLFILLPTTSLISFTMLVACQNKTENPIEKEPAIEDLIEGQEIEEDEKPINTFPNDGIVENKKQVEGYPVSAKAYETRNSEYKPYLGSGVEENFSNKKYQTGIVPNEQYKFINDYTVRLISEKKSSTEKDKPSKTEGTAWVLDFIQPEDNSYPLTWFFATNAHVIADMKFPNNPYKVLVPSDEAHSDYDSFQFAYTDNINDQLTETKFSTKLTKDQSSKFPKLVFVAANFLGKQTTISQYSGTKLGEKFTYENYFKDFAVIEYTFENVEEAKRVTRDFAIKYKNQKTQFAKKSLLNKTSDELRQFNDIYVLGYPSTSLKPTINKEEGDLDYSFGSGLSLRDKYQVTNKFGQNMNGISDATLVVVPNLNYNKKLKEIYQRIGMLYSIENDFLGGGASGSMVVNKEKEIIGIQHANDQITRVGYADPLIMEGFTINGEIVFPAYDLINGGAIGQISSYKDSFKERHSGKKSWLFGQM